MPTSCTTRLTNLRSWGGRVSGKLNPSAFSEVVANEILNEGIFSLDIRKTAHSQSVTLQSLYYYWDSQDFVKRDALCTYVRKQCTHVKKLIADWLHGSGNAEQGTNPPPDLPPLPSELVVNFGKIVEAHLLLRGTNEFELTKDEISSLAENIFEMGESTVLGPNLFPRLLEAVFQRWCLEASAFPESESG